MYIILPINNSPERISYLSGKRSTYVTIFNQTKSQHFIHRYNSAMDFYSSVSGILVVHISDYSGKLCLSAGLEREFTMFWTNHRAYSDHMYYLWHYGYVLLCNILLFPQPKNGIFCKYIFLAD